MKWTHITTRKPMKNADVFVAMLQRYTNAPWKWVYSTARWNGDQFIDDSGHGLMDVEAWVTPEPPPRKDVK